MKSQRSQVIALALLLVVWAACWVLFIREPTSPQAAAKPKPEKAIQPESLLVNRFHRVRAEMDALYHYRTKPAPFDAHWNPFRIPGVSAGSANVAETAGGKGQEQAPFVPPPNFAETLLKGAIASMRIGGVVDMNGTIQFTVNGQLHKEGDVFAAKVQSGTLGANAPYKSVLIRVKHLSTTSVTLALDDEQAGGAEIRVRLY
jgi:hypothetical protein